LSVAAQPARYLPRSAFAVELHERIDRYFDERGCSRRDARCMYVKTAVIMLWLAGSYVGLLLAPNWWVGAALAVSLGLAMAGVGFNVQHDGGHGAYSVHPWVNRIMARSLDLLGGNAYFWHFKHNIAHHTHTNISGQDDDISLGVLGRLSPHDPWRPPYRYQHLYVWALYALLALEWQTTGEFRNLLTKTHSGMTRVPPLSRNQKALFWIFKVTFFGLAFGIPLLLHRSVGAVLGAYVISTVTLGLTLATVFQLAHCVEGADFARVPEETPLLQREWAVHQVESTVDFAPANRLLAWYLGGLNFQIEHHLFPRVCHVHYPALAPIVEDVCRNHGIRYGVHPTMRAALRSHWRWLRAMGRRPEEAAQPAS
jgi:linoleoyl-CoA desaturase